MKVTRPAIIEYLGTYIQYTAILVPYIQYLGSYICCIHPQSLTAHPCKMIGLEEDPASFLVFGILSGESSLVKLSRSSWKSLHNLYSYMKAPKELPSFVGSNRPAPLYTPQLPVPIYIWNQGSSYLTYWQLGGWFQIYREMEDQGTILIIYIYMLYQYLYKYIYIYTHLGFPWTFLRFQLIGPKKKNTVLPSQTVVSSTNFRWRNLWPPSRRTDGRSNLEDLRIQRRKVHIGDKRDLPALMTRILIMDI